MGERKKLIMSDLDNNKKNEQDYEYVFEAKLILVGEPEAGKTSLVKKLLDPESPLNKEEPLTKGIDIMQWIFPYKKTPLLLMYGILGARI